MLGVTSRVAPPLSPRYSSTNGRQLRAFSDMAHIALWGGTSLGGLAALAAAMLLTAPCQVSAEPGGARSESSTPAQPQQAKQIEPMVEPVKRVTPKTPDLGQSGKGDGKSEPKGSAAKSADKTRKVKLVGIKPNCDAGYEPDKAGRRCVKAPEARARKKSRTGP